MTGPAQPRITSKHEGGAGEMKAEGGQKWPDSVLMSRGGGRGFVGGPTFDVIQRAPN